MLGIISCFSTIRGIFALCKRSSSGKNGGALPSLALSVFLIAPMANAETFYVSPNTAETGSGSQTAPWGSVAAALNSGRVKGGDTVLLAPGNYGDLTIAGARFDSPVDLRSDFGAEAHFTSVTVKNSQNIHFSHLKVWATSPREGDPSLVQVERNSPDIEFAQIDLRSTQDAADYRRWDAQTWLRNQASGFLMLGPRNTVRNSKVTGIRFGIAITGDGSQIIGNRVDGFSGDALRVLGDNSKLAGNVVENCVKVDDNHDDGIQSWSTGPDGKPDGGTVRNLLIENNIINEWTGTRNHPLICDLQGIWLTRKMDGLVVRNNAVSVSAYHGIAVGGASNTQIVNNTLVNSRGPNPESPWLGIFGSDANDGILIANNIAPNFNVNGNVDYRSPDLRNLTVVYPAQELRAPAAGDFRPARGSKLINAGNAAYAPRTDLDGTPRSLGGAPDIGAYEVE